jgi:hypothetical protein
MNLKDNKVLKPITIVTLLYSAFIFIKYFRTLSGIFYEPENPLIPRYLTYYAAFPLFFFVPLFALIIIACGQILRINKYDYRVVYSLLGLVLLFFIFQRIIFEFFISINPYGF